MVIKAEVRTKLARMIAEGDRVIDAAVKLGLTEQQARSIAGEPSFRIAVDAFQELHHNEMRGAIAAVQGQIVDSLLSIAMQPVQGASPDALLAAKLEAARLLLQAPAIDARLSRMTGEIADLKLQLQKLTEPN